MERRQSANAEEAVCVNDVLDSKEKRKSWGVCYCGGAKVVKEIVRRSASLSWISSQD